MNETLRVRRPRRMTQHALARRKAITPLYVANRSLTAPPAPPSLPLREGFACRLLNVIVALIGIVLTSPLMALIALGVKLSSPGPVFYMQTRVGLNRRTGRTPNGTAGARDAGGRPFTIYKFRTMYHEPADAAEVWARPGDPRITTVGRVLRRYRLDELPQLFNVLRGDMNVVGPRPEQPQLVRELRARIPSYPERLRVRPGITGLAQVTLPYDQCMDDVRRKLALDVEYVRRHSVREDVRIMLRTPIVMLGRRGAI